MAAGQSIPTIPPALAAAIRSSDSIRDRLERTGFPHPEKSPRGCLTSQFDSTYLQPGTGDVGKSACARKYYAKRSRSSAADPPTAHQ